MNKGCNNLHFVPLNSFYVRYTLDQLIFITNMAKKSQLRWQGQNIISINKAGKISTIFSNKPFSDLTTGVSRTP